ncbi:1-phosphofructokinase family hexose kinase [Georgenia subflava]|uniref:Phosphofructokinase n=1 Tax=Georgenia subflava TaxID=1622177 RepID=A0A6N7EL62_9MICO|nr:PfkB family carbohydrate kinase [Georgenia subflava]MPV36866.1 phosphofructokinase [Georgenia subflava]
MDGTTPAAVSAPGQRLAGPRTETVPDVISGGTPVRPRICVVAPTPLLVVEIASGHEDSGMSNEHADIHLHPGGQGLWVARMAVSLGAEVTVCAPFGGEVGAHVAQMLGTDQLTIHGVTYNGGNGAYVYDLRGEDRETVAYMPPPSLNRHELDDLYGTVLVDALESDVLVVTGAEPSSVVPASFFGRIVRDLRSAGKAVVADLSGAAARAAAKAGPTVLKMSHEEVVAAELAPDDEMGSLRTAAEQLVAGGVGAMVVSRAQAHALLVTTEGVRRAVGPVVTPLDHRGAGDSMTAGIAVGLGRGLDVADAVRLGAAAGALNVTRRGLGTGRRDQIERFAERISIEEMD